jgi:hypothetical protein
VEAGGIRHEPPLFSTCYAARMGNQDGLLSEIEKVLKERYKGKETTPVSPVPSTAQASARATRVDQLVLPDSERAKMPLTKKQYLVRENPELIQWEREARKFLRQLSPEHEHRVAAVMIYEWATGLPITAHMEAEKTTPRVQGQPTWRADIQKLNKILTHYFGKPYMTYIAGRKVKKAYRVRPGYYIYRHRPMTLALWVEWKQGVKL